jgi:hypothetical protein
MQRPERLELVAARKAQAAGEPGANERVLNATVACMATFAARLTTREERIAGMRKDIEIWHVPVSAVAFAYRATADEFDTAFGDLMAPPIVDPEIAALRALPYDAYLRTPHWRKVRTEALRQADNRCILCNSGRELEVHHRTYTRRGCEIQADVNVLCATCHARHHGRERVAA